MTDFTIEKELIRLMDDEPGSSSAAFCESTPMFSGMISDFDKSVPTALWISEMIEKRKFQDDLARQKLGRVWFGTKKWDETPQWKKDMIRDHNKGVADAVAALLNQSPAVRIRLTAHEYKFLTKDEKKKVDSHNEKICGSWRRTETSGRIQ